MHISEFDYELPRELIAQEPIRPRDASRLLVVDRRSGRLTDSCFTNLPEFLEPSDVLVLNNTRVIRARIFGVLERTGRTLEVLFTGPVSKSLWEVMLSPARRVRQGDRILFSGGVLAGAVGEVREHGLRLLALEGTEPLEAVLERDGHMPLPPYIAREDKRSDVEDYQTVFARSPGSVAAPTAGLHFTGRILDRLRARGIEIHEITLHVGVGTFLPVRTEHPEDHRLKPERFRISDETALAMNLARSQGRRIGAVGTTTARTLEYVFGRAGRFEPGTGEADLYILPGYRFQAVDVLLTNFHLPRSTLLMLVCAFASREIILKAYRHAVEEQYRFYSYGDCMLLLQYVNDHPEVKFSGHSPV